ncbi:PadR family transcriptional regulator [Asticcacaulis machinosus]|uniref:PadR family transcriptional regulator n=1 Tax=Asticcacaulis machinosus TaxID=2984211 RepID=A0ABT5HE98_9CAUL|nr:PadR family transcriptional regulator [Asticcacaulis machinosus]MDC7674586.1 PadR family transcriptional regulator [Asticcacaulis machinosus]
MNKFTHMRHGGTHPLRQRDDIFGGFGRGRQGRRGVKDSAADGRDGGRRGGRMFGHGGLRLVLLTYISEKPSHGYELIKAIEDKLDGAYSPSPGVVYPILTWIEELGYATVTATEDGRKRYSITEAGQAFLAENAEAVAESMSRLERGQAKSAGRPPQIVRAIENFKTALSLRLERQPLTSSEVDAIADILDDAAKKLERT